MSATPAPGATPGAAGATATRDLDPLDTLMRPRPTALVVGEESLERAVRDVFTEAEAPIGVERVEDYLMALGKLGWETPRVLIGRARELDESLLVTTAAIRRLAPRTRLLLVVRPDEEPLATRAVEAGFDDYVIEPIDPDELMEALGDALKARVQENESEPREANQAAPSPPPAAPAPAPPHNTAGPTATVSAIEDEWGVTELAFASPEATAGLAPSAPAPSAPPMRPTTVPTSGHELGDVDLLQQLLADPRKFRPLVLRLLAAQSAFPGVGLAANQDAIPAGHVSVAVEYRSVKLGVLHAGASVSSDGLAGWASWLGYWLALERKLTDLSDIAYKDELTGVWNRRYFNRFFEQVMARASRERFRVTLLIFDIDDFKSYNDRFGHAAGDDILRESARLMQSVVRTHDVVARIGGDEFAVIFWDAEGPRQPNSQHPQSVLGTAQRFQRAICEHRFPKLLHQAPGTLTISGGLAGFPWDGRTTQELLELADSRALQSKRDGKNAIKFGPGAEQTCKYLPK